MTLAHQPSSENVPDTIATDAGFHSQVDSREEIRISGEDMDLFLSRLLAWERDHSPTDELERFLVRQAATLSWRIERADRAETARLSFHVLTHASEAQARRLDRVLELGQKLIPADAEIRNLQNDLNGYYAKRPSRPDRGDDGTHMPHYSFWPYRPCGLGIRTPPLLGDDPARTVAELESIPEGCRWLLHHWAELRTAAASGRAWLTAEKFRACRLMGRQPTQAADDYAVSDIFMACHVLGDGENTPFQELRLLMSSTEYDSYAERLLARKVDERRPKSHEEATALLIATADRAETHLKARLADFENASGKPGGPAEQSRGLYDPGPEMAGLHRLQSTLRREFLKVLEALERRKKARARERKESEQGQRLQSLTPERGEPRSVGRSEARPTCHNLNPPLSDQTVTISHEYLGEGLELLPKPLAPVPRGVGPRDGGKGASEASRCERPDDPAEIADRRSPLGGPRFASTHTTESFSEHVETQDRRSSDPRVVTGTTSADRTPIIDTDQHRARDRARRAALRDWQRNRHRRRGPMPGSSDSEKIREKSGSPSQSAVS